MIKNFGSLIIGLLVSLACGSSPAFAHEHEPEIAPEVMLLGSYHLANNNRDLVNLPIDDVLTPRRQAEIIELVESLAVWQPTKIVVEWDRSDQKGLNERYQAYLRGDEGLTASETDQIGLRLAKQLGHKQVYSADWNESFPGDWAEYDFLSWARENGEACRLQNWIEREQAKLNAKAAIMRDQTVSQWYYDRNSPETLAEDHRQYFELATFGDNRSNPGAAWVGGWYGRNLRIFNNIKDELASGERILVLYGAGHIYHLDRFFKETQIARLVSPLGYIERKREPSKTEL